MWMKMNDYEYIARRIKEFSSLLTEKLGEKQIPEVFTHQREIHSAFFRCIGDSLVMNEHEAQERIREWINRIKQAGIKLHPSNYLGHLYKSVILDLIEDDIIQNSISSHNLIKIIKKIDCLIYYASTFFSKENQQKQENEDHYLTHASMDRKITLQELKDLKRALNEATIFAITNKDDIITYANDKFCQITKYSLSEIIGQNHHDLLFSGYHEEEFFQNILDAIEHGRVWKGEICNKAKDGSLYWVDTTIVPYIDSNGETYQHISIQHDITEQKEAEEKILKTEKLSMVGELAAGIAHEIRNPLTTIRGFVQILDHFSEEKKFLYSKTILEEIDRINFIISEFMVFAKPHTVYFKECNIIELLKKVLHLLGAEAALKNVEISSKFQSEYIFIYGEKNQLTQVFLNMIKNSIEALPIGGKIHISITTKDNHALISIKDNGIGMTEDQLQKLGQPFYTTKDDGNGLGLMVSYKIIEKHKGRISVESKPEKGTQFTITFPLLTKKDKNESEKKHSNDIDFL